MNQPAPCDVTCPVCAAHFTESDGRACRASCPLPSGCHLLSCPNCGYEMPAPTRFTRWLGRWLGGGGRSAER